MGQGSTIMESFADDDADATSADSGTPRGRAGHRGALVRTRAYSRLPIVSPSCAADGEGKEAAGGEESLIARLRRRSGPAPAGDPSKEGGGGRHGGAADAALRLPALERSAVYPLHPRRGRGSDDANHASASRPAHPSQAMDERRRDSATRRNSYRTLLSRFTIPWENSSSEDDSAAASAEGPSDGARGGANSANKRTGRAAPPAAAAVTQATAPPHRPPGGRQEGYRTETQRVSPQKQGQQGGARGLSVRPPNVLTNSTHNHYSTYHHPTPPNKENTTPPGANTYSSCVGTLGKAAVGNTTCHKPSGGSPQQAWLCTAPNRTTLVCSGLPPTPVVADRRQHEAVRHTLSGSQHYNPLLAQHSPATSPSTNVGTQQPHAAHTPERERHRRYSANDAMLAVPMVDNRLLAPLEQQDDRTNIYGGARPVSQRFLRRQVSFIDKPEDHQSSVQIDV
ncbi:hypothetical protein STCU_10777 [Strigomonas culicis]|uniref:Uncharacterized protein n=1 Tax=Strigomonas culicis TaxID=28005 RepID=S9TLG2_9TRYP|nr:hypothetical protein STCU_10777 [Strigomonas culicis]|eukprot:EPY17193.1 hypothetical protein STCU_10777 [Strigomonas culicis]